LGLNWCGGAVAPGGSCRVDFFFTPAAAGVRNATLSITSDGGSADIALSGTGVAVPTTTTTPAAPSATTTTVVTTTGTPGAVSTTPARPNTASARPALALKSLAVAPRIKQRKARKTGLRLVMRLPNGTEVVKINVYRRTGKGLKLLSSGLKAPSAAGLYRVAQNHAALRRLLTKGSYQVQVTPGYSKSELGTTRKASFKVV
jgi:hypothetical protein